MCWPSRCTIPDDDEPGPIRHVVPRVRRHDHSRASSHTGLAARVDAAGSRQHTAGDAPDRRGPDHRAPSAARDRRGQRGARSDLTGNEGERGTRPDLTLSDKVASPAHTRRECSAAKRSASTRRARRLIASRRSVLVRDTLADWRERPRVNRRLQPQHFIVREMTAAVFTTDHRLDHTSVCLISLYYLRPKPVMCQNRDRLDLVGWYPGEPVGAGTYGSHRNYQP